MLIQSLGTEDDKKGLCQLLGKLYIPDVVDDDKIRTLHLLLQNLRTVRIQCFDTINDTKIIRIASTTSGYNVEEFLPQIRDAHLEQV